MGTSLPASSEVNKTWSCNSSLPKNLQSVTLIRYKGNFYLLILKLLLFSQNLFLAADATVISLSYVRQAVLRKQTAHLDSFAGS
jgi:hypothetical protein